MTARREMIYSIKEFKNEPISHLVIFIEEIEGVQTNLRKRQLYLETLKQLSTSADKEAVLQLVKEEMHFSGKVGDREDFETKAFNKIRVEAAHALQILKSLYQTKKLYYKHQLLVCDLLTKHEFFLTLGPPSKGKIELEGWIEIKKQEVPLRECDFLIPGTPYLFIYKNFLGIISEKIEWKWLRQCFGKEPFMLSVGKVEDLFEEEENEASLPKIRRREESALTESLAVKQVEVFPILKLTDRSGAFANLIMDYGEERKISIHDPLKTVSSPESNMRYPRDFPSEKQWEKDLLETDYALKPVGSSFYYCPLDKVGKSLTFLLECGWTIFDAKGSTVVKQGAAHFNLKKREEDIVAVGKVAYDKFEADLKDVIGAFNRRERFIELSSGLSGLISDDVMEKEFGSALLEGEVVAEGIKIRKNQLGSLADLCKSKSADSTMNLDLSVKKLLERINAFDDEVTPADYLPSDQFKGSLRHYQQMGLNWLSFLKEYGFHGILADDMGLGKTVQVLAFLSRHQWKGAGLIVAPTSLLFNWRKEVEKFLPSLSVKIHHGLDRGKTEEEFPQGTLVLTSYALLRNDQLFFEKFDWDFIILDEAQAIKNPDTKSSKAVCSLRAKFRLCMTGTPIENSLKDIWGQFQFLMPDLLGSKAEFQKLIEASAFDSRHLQVLKKKIRPFMLRRTKKEVAKDLPEKVEQVVWVEMSPEQREIYEGYLKGVRSNLLKKISLDGISSHRIEVFESILRLRQICCHPLLVEHILDPSKERDLSSCSGKWDILMDDLETIVKENRKALVYSQFTSMLQLIAKYIKLQQWNFCYLDGSTTDREEVVRKFQEEPEINIFLISLKAGGVGLNLTSADYVILYDPWWNTAVENQAIDRAHRIGRTEPVIAKRLVAVESIEEKMMKLKAAKQALSENLWEGQLELSAMSEEDLHFLLN